MRNLLDPNRYLVKQDVGSELQRVFAGRPKKPFRVHPDDLYGQGPYAVTNFNRKWHLIDAKIAAREFVPRKTTAYLCRAICDDGSLTLIVVDEPWPNHPSDWFDGWCDIIPVAVEHWVVVEKDNGRPTCQRVPGAGEPEWPDLQFAEWLTEAFKGNVIDSLSHPIFSQRVSDRQRFGKS